MSTRPPQNDAAKQLQQALGAIRELRTRLEDVERSRREPIAIVGMGCRVPGADNPEAFWELLRDGVDAITETPPERWDNATLYDPDAASPGTVTTRWGGFLPDIDRFDASFFGIAPREAAQMDPQQRLLLEVAYEALEDAGQPIEQLAGSRTGVFVGLHSQSNDYFLMQSADTSAIDLYSGTGTSHSVAAGRLSYLFDFRGPCVTLDTACSSSLVAIHLAVRSLRSGESDLALAGGVNAMLDPTFTIAASRMQMLASDGRCKTFDAAADGFVRSEGCGVVILKRLSDAVAAGDPVHAVIYGSAINQDGNSNGLTAPSGMSQQNVIRDALKDAGISPDRIGYVEAHGTGTSLGDPIEVEALGAVLGAPRADGLRCLLGSAKANLGHLEGAAGVTGLIKSVLSLRHELIPILPNFQTLNPHIVLDGTPLAIPVEPVPWPAASEPRFAGVSSFGWSGTNAHVIVGDPPEIDHVRTTQNESHHDVPAMLAISARSAASLTALARAYASRLSGPDAPALHDIAWSAATRRSQLNERLTVVGKKAETLARGLTDFAEGRPTTGISRGSTGSRPPRLAFVMPGQGGQWLGMGRRLAATEPVFARSLQRCSAAIQDETGWSLLDVLEATPEASRLHEIDVVQPAIFAMQVALADLLASWGLRPDVVVGHSLGEVAAAHIAGILSLEDAAAVICRRSRLLKRVAGRGAMGVVNLTLPDATALVKQFGDRLSVAASNGPQTTVLAGEIAALDEALAQVTNTGGFARRVQVDVASHSAQVEPLLADLQSALENLSPAPAKLGFASTVAGDYLIGTELDADYWCRNLRQPVLFGPVVEKLLSEGDTVFVELSPHPVLLTAIEGAISAAGAPSIAVGTLRRDHDEAEAIREAVGMLWTAGLDVDLARISPGRTVLPLPTYQWQRERYWFTSAPRPVASSYPPLAQESNSTFLGTALPDLAHLPGSHFWQGRIDPSEDLAHSLVEGAPIVPGILAAQIATAVADAECDVVEDLVLRNQPLLTDPIETQTVLTPSTDGAGLQIFTRQAECATWDLWASARICTCGHALELEDFTKLQARLSPSATYGTFTSESEVLSRITDPLTSDIELLTIGTALLANLAVNQAQLLVGVDRVLVPREPDRVAWIYVRRNNEQNVSGDVVFLTDDGSVIGQLTGVRLGEPDGALLEQAAISRMDDWFYGVDWKPVERTTVSALNGAWLIVADKGDLGHRLAAWFETGGARSSVTTVPVNQLELEPLLDEALRSLARDVAGIIDLRYVDSDLRDLPCAVESQTTAALALAQAVARSTQRGNTRLWFVTRGAQVVDGPSKSPAAAAVWGIGRVIANEHPELWGGLVDLDPLEGPDEVDLLGEALVVNDHECEQVVRSNNRLVARVARCTDIATSTAKLRPDGTYLITGGAGGVGLVIAGWMAGAGARHLVLVGRGPLRDDVRQTIAALEEVGTQVAYLQADIARPDDVKRLLDSIADDLPPLRGIVHAAGVLADATLLQQSPDSLRTVLDPKVRGAWNLAVAARDLPLDFLVFFSSASALLGTPGQSNYAAANAVLDAYAGQLGAEGTPAMSIAWGRWGSVGLATSDTSAASLDRLGIRSMPPAAGVGAFGRAISSSSDYLTVLDIDWRTFLEQHESPRFSTVAPATDAEERPTALSNGASYRATLEALPSGERPERVLEHVRSLTAAVLRFDDPRRVLPGQGFFQIGMDSLTAVELKNRLQNSLGLTLPATIAFDYPTPAALADRLMEDLFPDAGIQTAQDVVDDLNGLADISPEDLRNLLDAELESIDEELVR